MTEDIYSNAIDYVCDFYNITRQECVEYYWEEVESMMTILPLIQIDKNNEEK
jgi:hypothetical protein